MTYEDLRLNSDDCNIARRRIVVRRDGKGRSLAGPQLIELLRRETDPPEAVQPRTHHAQVVRDLGRMIVAGNYPENGILPGDAELLDRHGVSRTVLREALKTLSAKGLIQARARIGTRVRERRHWHLFDPDILTWLVEAGIDVNFMISLSEMRLALEPEAAALAAVRRTPSQLAELYRCIERMAASNSGPRFVESDLRFHVAVAEASGNPFMRSISALVEVALATTFKVSSPIPNSEKHAASVASHLAIAVAIEGRDAEGARTAMRDVIQEGVARVTAVSRDGFARVV